MIYSAIPLGAKTDEIFQEPSRLNLKKKNFSKSTRWEREHYD